MATVTCLFFILPSFSSLLMSPTSICCLIILLHLGFLGDDRHQAERHAARLQPCMCCKLQKCICTRNPTTTTKAPTMPPFLSLSPLFFSFLLLITLSHSHFLQQQVHIRTPDRSQPVCNRALRFGHSCHCLTLFVSCLSFAFPFALYRSLLLFSQQERTQQTHTATTTKISVTIRPRSLPFVFLPLFIRLG